MEKRTWFTPRQEQFLELVARNENFKAHFYFTGGTALSAVYLNHRESHDLDFFTQKQESLSAVGGLVASTAKKLGWIGMTREIGFPVNMYVLKWADGTSLKVDFNYYAFNRLRRGSNVFGISTDSIEDIAANKFDTIFSRRQARDYVDLFSIVKSGKINFDTILRLHRKKFMEVDDLAIVKALLLVNEAQDYPVMKVEFNKDEMISFFEKVARKMGSKIFNK